MDPRVKTPATGLQKQFQLEMRLASLLTSNSELIIQARSIREQLNKLSEKTTGPAKEAVQALEKKLTTLIQGSKQPSPGSGEITLNRVNDAAMTLYGDVDKADATPTAAQVDATKDAEQDAANVTKRWDAIKTSDLTALNNFLRGAALPEIRMDLNPRVGAGQGVENSNAR
jgi:hypothetical protein